MSRYRPNQSHRFSSRAVKVAQLLMARAIGLCATLLGVMAVYATPTLAETEPFRLNMCEDRTTQGWSFYCREAPPTEEKEPEPTVPSEVTPQTSTPAATELGPELVYPATEAMMAYRARIDELKYRAVLDPTEDNL